jgi:ubiquinone/menaquinone biosynthesis C-methylase UbiE
MDFETIKSKLGDMFNHWADFLKKVVDDLHLPIKSKILDIGTGRGVMAVVLASSGYRVITGEPAQDHFANWQEWVNLVKLEKKITFQPFEAEHLPFTNDDFDGIFLYGSLHHIKDRTQAISECLRCLKPKTGVLVIFEQTPPGVNYIRQHRPDHPDAINPMDYFKEVPENFRIIKHPELKAYIFQK